MDSTMTIQVRVVGRQAIAQLGQVQAAVNGVSRATGGAAAKNASGFFNVLNSNLVKAGKNFQWVGRQLTFNFTLPLVAAGVALFKANQAITKSMTQVIKVYGDASFGMEAYNQVLASGGSIAEATAAKQEAAAARVKEETDALRVSFELLSTRFGVHQEEVIDIAAAWAQAGSAGRGLAENTRATLEAMILGEMDAAEATQGLIAIQATWGLSTMARAGEVSELHQALALLNVVENQTGISFSGLIEVFERAGGAARTAGMTVRELAAFSAALVPATGSAAQAGNALKTMISRLVAPTKETSAILGEMGINVESFGWRSLSATDKILTMADSFNALSQAEKNQVSSIIASRWQVNRFSVLMQDVANQTGYFNKAMEATADQALANATYQRELMAVLESSPKKWDIMTNAIRNSMAKAFIPLMPIIMNIIGMIAQLAEKFRNLDPDTQKWIMIGLAILAVVGPIMQLTGAFMELGGIIIGISKGIAMIIIRGLIPVIMFLVNAVVSAVVAIGTALAGLGLPLWAVVAIVAAVVVAILAIFNDDFRNGLIDFIKGVAQAFAWLPQVIVTVFNAIIRIISQAIEIIRDALSYLNPFARHSPSLVDNVKAGVATILDEYSKFKHIPGIIRSAIAALQAFGQASAPGARDQQQAELQGYASSIAKNDPAAGAAASAMIPQIMALQDQLAPLAQEIEAQSIVVAQWTDKLKDADAALAVAEASLEATKNQFEKVSDQLDAAKNRLQELANTPLTGMKAMEDILFDISMQQNQLNLQLVEFERQGYTIDSIREKYAALNGEIELLRGEQADLRNAGAGSDVLAVYDDQIAAIEEQRQSMGGVEQQIIDIQNQLDALDLEKRFQELTKSITFDPLLKQIDEMVNGVSEMSFDDVVAGIQEQQALIAQLQPQYDSLLATMEEQQAAVDAAQATRDEIAAQLDVEQTKLDGLNDAYQGIKNLIDEMTSAMRDYASAAEAAASAGGAGGGAGGGLGVPADYPIAGGASTLGPEGTLADIEAFNAELEAELQGVLEGMGGIDIFGELRKKWDGAVKWLKDAWQGISDWFSGLWTDIKGWFDGLDIGGWFSDTFGGVIDWFNNSFLPWWDGIWKWVSDVMLAAWEWIDQNVVPVVESIVNFIIVAWGVLAPYIEGIWAIIKGIIQAALLTIGTVIRSALLIIGTIIKVALTAIQTAWSIVWNAISGVVMIVWNTIWGIIEGALKIIKGVFDIFAGLFSGDWGRMWEGIKSIFAGAWQIIVSIFQGAWDLIILILETAWDTVVLIIETAWDLIWGIIEGAFKIITWLWETSWEAIAAIVRGVWTGIQRFIEGILNIVFNIVNTIIGGVRAAWDGLWTFLSGLWNTISTTASTVWEGIKNAVMNPIDTLKGLLQGAWDTITSAAETAWNGITSFIGGVVDGIGSTVSGIWQGIIDGVKGAVNAVVRAINWVIRQINGFQIHISIDPLGMWGPEVNFDWNGLNIPLIPEWGGTSLGGGGGGGGAGGVKYMADGGIVDKALLAVIGEAGKEVVIPLTDADRAWKLAQQSGLMNVIARKMQQSGYTSGNSQTGPMYASSSGGNVTVVNVNGDLSFPNIKNGDDASKFIENLKVIAS